MIPVTGEKGRAYLCYLRVSDIESLGHGQQQVCSIDLSFFSFWRSIVLSFNGGRKVTVSVWMVKAQEILGLLLEGIQERETRVDRDASITQKGKSTSTGWGPWWRGGGGGKVLGLSWWRRTAPVVNG